MDCVGAALTVLGLGIEVVALYRILRSVGVVGEVRTRLRRRLEDLRRLLPWTKTRQVSRRVTLGIADEINVAESIVAKKTRHPQPPPGDLGEVGDRLNTLAADLNDLEERLLTRASKTDERISEEIGRVAQEASERHQRIDERVEKFVAQAFEARRSEAIWFFVGIAVQLVGAVFILGW